MAIIETIISSMLGHFYIVSFLSGIFGEEAVLFLTFLASQNFMNIESIFILAPLGILCMDILYFSIGKTELLHKIAKKISLLSDKMKIAGWAARFGDKSPFTALTFTKFIFGTRMPLMIYLGKRGISYGRFAIMDVIAVYIWALVMIPLAWLAGIGLTGGLHLVKDFSKIVGIAILFVIAVYAVNAIIRDYLAKRMAAKNNIKINSEINLKQIQDGQ